MAKIAAMPGQDVIDALRGTLDFYRWCDLVIVRAWPRSPSGPRSPQVKVKSNQFSWATAHQKTLPKNVTDAFKELAQQTSFTWKDWFVRQYVNSTKDFYEYQIGVESPPA